MKYIRNRIFEAKYKDIESEYGSIGNYIEYIGDNTDDKELFDQIVNKHLTDYNPKIRIANSVETINTFDKLLLVDELERECLIKEDLQSDIIDNTVGGKGSFTSFLKVLTAAGIKELKVDNKKCAKEYLIVYDSDNIQKDELLRVLNRFQSLGLAKKKITESTAENYGTYYSVKFNNKLYIEYGLLLDNKKEKIGEFVLNKQTLDSLLSLNNKVISQFKDDFKDVDLSNITFLSKIKNDLNLYSPGYFRSKSEVYLDIKNNVAILDVYGLGEWSGPELKEGELEKYKNEFNSWVLSNKWNSKVLTSIKASDFWIQFKIKIKI